MHEAEEKARQDLYEAISAGVAEANKFSNAAVRARVLADLALAYRYTDGGAQPGSVTVEK